MPADLRPHLDLVDQALHSVGRRERKTLADRAAVNAALILEVGGHHASVPLTRSRAPGQDDGPAWA